MTQRLPKDQTMGSALGLALCLFLILALTGAAPDPASAQVARSSSASFQVRLLLIPDPNACLLASSVQALGPQVSLSCTRDTAPTLMPLSTMASTASATSGSGFGALAAEAMMNNGGPGLTGTSSPLGPAGSAAEAANSGPLFNPLLVGADTGQRRALDKSTWPYTTWFSVGRWRDAELLVSF